MGEFHKDISYNETSIPAEIQARIRDEVAQDIAMLVDEGDIKTAEFLQDVMLDLREGTYSVLAWLKKKEDPQKILYPASGSDIVPKLVFGEDRVVHTSLEDKRGDDQTYFGRLGTGLKVLADNQALPFKDNAFELICLLDSQEDTIGTDPDIYTRVLAPGGYIVMSKNNTLNPEDTRLETYEQTSSLEQAPMPERFQFIGDAQVEFALFRKIRE